MPTCPNADPDLYCARCEEKIRKGTTYYTATDWDYRKVEFCSMDCLKRFFNIEEEEA